MSHPIHFEDRMSQADTLMWNLENDPVLRSTITSVWVLDARPDPERLHRQLERATRIIPRLRQRVVSDPLGLAPPRWEVDPHFDLCFHVRRVRAPEPGDERSLLDLARPIAMQSFDKDRPLWELTLVDGLEGGRSAVVMKLHHAISDGVGLVRMTECLIERTRDGSPEKPGRPLPEAPAARPVGSWDRTRDALGHRLRRRGAGLRDAALGVSRGVGSMLRSPVESARKLAGTAASIGRVLAPATQPMSPLMTDRSLGLRFDTLSVPLEDLKRTGRALGGTVNDVFVAAVAGGLGRYHESLGHPTDSLRMLMPVNMRSGEKGRRAGNQFAPARFAVPTGPLDPEERIRRVGALVREQRDEPALPLIDPISAALGGLPTAATVALFGAMQRTTDFTTSNVPGPPFETYVCGAKIERFMPFGPLAGAAINVTVFSYAGQMDLGIASDPAAVSEPELLVECLRKSFDEVLAAA
ncbi:MAG: wax ester/triacylglycerol synthase family O-acyltransferase [Myxococcota bacterium]